mmetsp:Transcript_14493/g.42801  ORF Transcript_14493/g.42801 Transcript_14493/m.42801 type:complete len:110 (-) Transcript_14493:14-343(-)
MTKGRNERANEYAMSPTSGSSLLKAVDGKVDEEVEEEEEEVNVSPALGELAWLLVFGDLVWKDTLFGVVSSRSLLVGLERTCAGDGSNLMERFRRPPSPPPPPPLLLLL